MSRKSVLPIACSLVLVAHVASGCAGSGRGVHSVASDAPPSSAAAQEPTAGESRLARKHSRSERTPSLVAKESGTSDGTTAASDTVEASWRARLAREPADAAALTRLSRLLYEQGRHAEAVALLEPLREGRVRLASGDRAAALAGLAMHEAALGRDDAARVLLASLPADAAPGVAAYLAVRGFATDSALAATERALRVAPESAVLRNNRGIALLRAGDADAASAEFERAIALDPARPGPYYNLAILERFYRLDTATAQRRFQQYWSRSHADPDSLHAELGRGRPATVAEGSGEK